MNNVWFTSDHHFGHLNILTYQPDERPFSSVEEMNEAMILRWNEVVKPQDTVYHVGDFCFGRANIAIAGRLNGRKNLIMGNHDHYPIEEYAQYFNKIRGVHYWKMCVLTHIPVHPENLGSRAFLNVHGHLHSKRILTHIDPDGVAFPDWTEPDPNYFNVSVEQNNLYPFHADQILERMKQNV